MNISWEEKITIVKALECFISEWDFPDGGETQFISEAKRLLQRLKK